MQVNLIGHAEALVAHRQLLQQNLPNETLKDFAVLVESVDVPGTFDVLTPLANGGYAGMDSATGTTYIVDDPVGSYQQ